jgi:hypothetical protein
MDMVIMYEPDYSLVYKDVTTTGATAGCPTLSIPVTAGHTYVLRLQGKSALTSYDITVSP